MCYLGEMLGAYSLVYSPISALRSNFNTASRSPYCEGATWRGAEGREERREID